MCCCAGNLLSIFHASYKLNHIKEQNRDNCHKHDCSFERSGNISESPQFIMILKRGRRGVAFLIIWVCLSSPRFVMYNI